MIKTLIRLQLKRNSCALFIHLFALFFKFVLQYAAAWRPNLKTTKSRLLALIITNNTQLSVFFGGFFCVTKVEKVHR